MIQRIRADYQRLKEWWWSRNGILETAFGGFRFSRSGDEMLYHLEERGVLEEVENHLDEEGCDCGEAEELEDLVAVSKDFEGLKLYCKECMI